MPKIKLKPLRGVFLTLNNQGPILCINYLDTATITFTTNLKFRMSPTCLFTAKA